MLFDPSQSARLSSANVTENRRTSVKSVLESRDFRTPKEKREDGSYEIKFESYG